MAAVPATSRFASDRWWRQGQACLARGQIDGARIALAELEAAGPARAVHASLLAAQLAWREDRIRDAARLALAAATTDDDPECAGIVAGVLLEVGENVAGRDCLDRVDVDACDDPRLLLRLALLRQRLEQHAEELALLDRAGSLGHVSPALRYNRGVALLYNGRLADAEAELASSLAEAPDRGRVAVPLVGLRRQTPDGNHLAALERGAQLAAPGSDDQAAFEFARYKTLEDLQRHDEAWQALARGNALMRARVPDPAAQHHQWLDSLISVAPALANRTRAAGRRAGATPIFIVGVPRCGSTLLERMVGNHSRVAVAGELHDFGAQLHWAADTRNGGTARMASRLPDLDYAELGRRYLAQTQWRAHGKDFFIDKQPPNWALVPMIHASIPWAPILNLVRDPMDTCFSNWRAYFGNACPYSYDLGALAAFYIDYRRVMARWHELLPGAILDVHYAELVNDPDAALRKVFAFCGLDWEPDCGDITRNAAPSATLSAAQVRSPLRRDTGGRWRHYAAPLAGLADALTKAGHPGAA